MVDPPSWGVVCVGGAMAGHAGKGDELVGFGRRSEKGRRQQQRHGRRRNRRRTRHGNVDVAHHVEPRDQLRRNRWCVCTNHERMDSVAP